MVIDDRLERKLRETHAEMLETGALLSSRRLEECYSLFRSRFGPDVLQQLDGEQLLDTMHAHGNKDSLVYWLEFKDDEELPAKFGSILGGSALKFGIYRRKECVDDRKPAETGRIKRRRSDTDRTATPG